VTETFLPPELLRLLLQIDEHWEKGGFPRDVQLGSRTAEDDQLLKPYELSDTVHRQLIHAVDHFHCLRSVIIEARIQHLAAPFTLMRAALENAAVAVWLLRPDDQAERLLRRLRLELANEADLDAAFNAIDYVPKRSSEERRRPVLERAEQLGLARSSLAGRPPGWATLIRDAGEAVRSGPGHCERMWRVCSGFAHGRQWANDVTFERHAANGLPERDGVPVRVTSPTHTVIRVATTAYEMLSAAYALHDRHRLHWKTS
jgi:hypothetical protein